MTEKTCQKSRNKYAKKKANFFLQSFIFVGRSTLTANAYGTLKGVSVSVVKRDKGGERAPMYGDILQRATQLEQRCSVLY